MINARSPALLHPQRIATTPIHAQACTTAPLLREQRASLCASIHNNTTTIYLFCKQPQIKWEGKAVNPSLKSVCIHCWVWVWFVLTIPCS